MKYEKYQLADFDTGERSEREAWRSLPNSWRHLDNCFPFRGQVLTRPGTLLIGKLYHKKGPHTFAGTMGLFTLTTSIPGGEVEPGFVVFTLGGGRTVTDDGLGVLNEGATPVGTIDYTNGDFTITVGVAFPNDVQVTYREYLAYAVTGLTEFTDNDGNRYFMATDKRRLFQWQTIHWVDVTGTDIFTGTDNDLVWFCPFENILVLTNNVDPPKKYTPAGGLGTVANMGTDFDGAGNDIDKALIVLNHKGRLLYMNVQEKGVRYSHRVRRTQPNNPEAFYDALDYSDAPTGSAILSAGIVSDTVVCLFEDNQAFAHRYRGDPLFLYDWVQISKESGSAATHSTLPVEGGLVVLSESALQSCDGRSLQRIDRANPTWVRDNLDRNQLEVAQAVRYFEFDQAWLSLFKLDAPDKSVLVLDLDKGAWAEFDFDFWVYATARSDTLSGVVWDSLPALPWDDPEFDVPWDAYGDASAVALRSLFAGSRNGIVYLISRNIVVDDGNAPILMEGVTQRLNPYIEGGMDASLGWVDFQFSRHDGYTVTVKLYQDFEESEYESVVIDLTGIGTARSVRRRVPANCTAQFHSVSFASNAPGFRVDSIEPYFAPARRMLESEVPAP